MAIRQMPVPKLMWTTDKGLSHLAATATIIKNTLNAVCNFWDRFCVIKICIFNPKTPADFSIVKF